MAQYNRPVKQKPPKVDEFISLFDRLLIQLKLHQNKFLIGLALGLAVLLVLGVLRYRDQKKFEAMAFEYFQAEKTSGPKALKAWQALIEKKLPGQLEQLVSIQMGSQYSAGHQWEQAADAFRQAASADSELIRWVATLAAATSFENEGKFSESEKLYQQLSQATDSFFSEQGRLGIARSWLGMGKSSEAESLLFELVAKESKAPAAVKAAALNQLLALKLQHGGTDSFPVPSSESHSTETSRE